MVTVSLKSKMGYKPIEDADPLANPRREELGMRPIRSHRYNFFNFMQFFRKNGQNNSYHPNSEVGAPIWEILDSPQWRYV